MRRISTFGTGQTVNESFRSYAWFRYEISDWNWLKSCFTVALEWTRCVYTDGIFRKIQKYIFFSFPNSPVRWKIVEYENLPKSHSSISWHNNKASSSFILGWNPVLHWQLYPANVFTHFAYLEHGLFSHSDGVSNMKFQTKEWKLEWIPRNFRGKVTRMITRINFAEIISGFYRIHPIHNFQ